MKRYAKTCHLRDDATAIAAYVREHERVWPEVLQALRDAGILEMRIWIAGPRLFMLCECVDSFEPERDWARYASAHPRIAEWEREMERYQVPPPESPGPKWMDMTEIFCLTDQLPVTGGRP